MPTMEMGQRTSRDLNDDLGADPDVSVEPAEFLQSLGPVREFHSHPLSVPSYSLSSSSTTLTLGHETHTTTIPNASVLLNSFKGVSEDSELDDFFLDGDCVFSLEAALPAELAQTASVLSPWLVVPPAPPHTHSSIALVQLLVPPYLLSLGTKVPYKTHPCVTSEYYVPSGAVSCQPSYVPTPLHLISSYQVQGSVSPSCLLSLEPAPHRMMLLAVQYPLSLLLGTPLTFSLRRVCPWFLPPHLIPWWLSPSPLVFLWPLMFLLQSCLLLFP